MTAAWPAPAAVVLGAAAVAETVLRAQPTPETVPDTAIPALGTAAALAILRLWPAVAAGLSGLACLLVVLLGGPPPVAGLAALAIACFLTGARHRGWLVVLPILP
ncbi:MAG: hypothetical protein HOV79_33000, partial [Hamadaea sp.]|nr:hypothetical protein [Hamadaea sp.]